MTESVNKPSILLHICCAPCATYPISCLSSQYNVTGFFFNPNIFPHSEWSLRKDHVQKYVNELKLPLIIPDQPHDQWLKICEYLAEESEGGSRCTECFYCRLNETARVAAANNIDYFTTTLTIGTNKPARIIFPLAEAAAAKYGVPYLPMDFKKKNGHQISVQMSKAAGMYRQNYCGCEFSLPQNR